jgi:cell wall-associated NlpC family hydrolase
VRALQGALGIAEDGIFGAQTERALRAFQRSHGIPATGSVGPLTQAALGLGDATARDLPSTAQLRAAAPASLTPDAVRALQRKLGVQADGIIGPRTRAALGSFETAHGLPVDGDPAPALKALGIDPASTDGLSGVQSDAANPTADASGAVHAAVAAAMSKVGSPYRSGGSGPDGFDCSGLVVWAMRQAGIAVPRTSFAQYTAGTAVPPSSIQAGDLVFFDTAGPGASDVGIATGPDTAVSATTHGVMTHSSRQGYWGEHFVGARRVA